MGEEPEKSNRGAWGNQLEFILTMVGFAVGLGNVWRFPYLCYKNGGGAFLVPYFIALFVLGIPIFFMETSFGQFASLGPLKIFRMNPAMKGVGMSVVLITTCIIIYYNVIVAYCIYFFFSSMTSRLPWTACENDWNTCYCRDSTMNTSFANPWPVNSSMHFECDGMVVNQSDSATPSEEFFVHRVLRRTSGLEEGGMLLWDVSLCNLLAWTVIFLVLARGVESLGKVMYFATTFPYILLTILLVRGLTLEGHQTGIDFYLTPNMTKLQEASVWSDATVQIFYSLGICQGGLIAMSSFNQFRTNVFRDSLIVPIINCATSFYAGFVIFSVLGFMAESKGVTIDQVAAGGPGLVFVVYPEALAQMPVAPVWAILFFLMMTMLGFSSQFSATETVLSSLMDEFPSIRRSRPRTIAFRGGCCFVFFLLGLPMTTEGGFFLLNLIDNYVGGFPLLFAGMFEIITIVYIYGLRTFIKDIEMMLGKRCMTSCAVIFFSPLWVFFTPALLLGVTIFKAIQYEPLTFEGYDYPGFGDAIGWLSALAPILIVPVFALGYCCWNGGMQVWVQSNTPKQKWGPALEEDRGERYKIPNMAVFDNIDIEQPIKSNLNGITNGKTNGTTGMVGNYNDAFHGDSDKTKIEGDTLEHF